MTFQFKIQIKNIIKPPVWRRLLVPASFSFERFHEVIQAAFGWENYHLYQFSRSGYGSAELIGIVDEEDDDDNPWRPYTKRDSSRVLLSEVFGSVGEKFVYIYDFGDDWTHQITLEDIREERMINAQLLAAKGACPPEDCGGVWGYENLKEVLGDKKHPEHKDMKEWLGMKPRQNWDADFVDMEILKMRVQQS